MAHAARPPVPRSVFAAKEEVRGNVLHPSGQNSRRNPLSIASPLRRCQVGVKVPGHKQRHTMGMLAGGCYDSIDGNRIIGGKEKINNEPASSFRFHLNTQHVWSVRLQRLDLEMGGFLVE